MVREVTLPVRRRSLLGSLAIASLIPPGLTRAAEVCGPPPSLEVRDEWDADAGVVVMPTDTHKSSFRICGDTIDLTTENFPSIVRKPVDAAPDVRELVFDARRIVVAGQLSLRRGTIRFIADEVEFASGSLITLVDPPLAGSELPIPSTPAQDGDGVIVVCRSLVFRDTVATPFAFFLAGGTAGKPVRRLHIVAETLVIRGQSIAPANAAAALKRLTLNAVFPPAPGTPASPGNAPLVVTLGEDAGPVYGKTFQKDALWPMAFAAKMKRVHAGAPYDPATKARLAGYAARYGPDLQRWRSPGPFAQVQGILVAMEAGLDGNGLSNRDVPRLALVDQIANLRKQIGDLEPGNYVDLLEQQILAPFAARHLDQLVLASMRARRESLKGEMDGIGGELGSEITQLADLTQQIDQLCTREQNARDDVARRLAEMKRRNETGWEIQQATKYVAMAASFIPVVGIAVSVGVGVAGTAIYRHNAPPGDEPDGSYLVTFEQIYAQSKAFKQQADALDAAWSDFTKSGTAALATWSPPPRETAAPSISRKMNAAKDFAGKSKILYGSIDDLLNAASVPKPQQILQSGLEATDPDLIDLLAQHQEINARRGESVDRIGQLKGAMLAASAKLTEIAAAEADMLVLDPVDDTSINRWADTARRLRSDFFADVYRAVSLLRRSAFYTNFSPNILSADVPLPADPTALQQPGPMASMASAYTKEWLSASFDSQKKRTSVAIEHLTDLATRQQQAYEAANLSRQYDETVTPLSGNTTPTTDQALFIQALNKAIADQVTRLTSNGPVSESGPMLVPVAWSNATTDALRFVAARVTKIAYRDASLLGHCVLTFRIYHPGHGRMARNGGCYEFDLRSGPASPANWHWDTVVTRATRPPDVRDMKADELAVSQEFYFKVARLPLRASYCMTISVSGDVSDVDVKHPPSVDSMEITMLGIR